MSIQSTLQQKGLSNLAAAIASLRKSEDIKPASPPQEKGVWKPDNENGQIVWEHELFGRMLVEVPFETEDPEKHGVFTAARIKVPLQNPPAFIRVKIKKKPLDGVKILHFQGSKAEMTDVSQEQCPDLVINVNWKKGKDGKITAMTRSANKDNVDVVFLRPDGMFMRLNIGVSTRDGRFFWLTIQEVSMSQVGTTTFEKVEVHGLTGCYGKFGNKCVVVVPVRSEDAYPGFNWLNVFKDIGEGLVSFALNHGCYLPLSKCAIAEWSPRTPPTLSQDLADAGFELAIVFWFNVAYGGGTLALEDMSTIWTHFKAVSDTSLQPLFEQGKFPALLPMTYVAVKHAPSPQMGGRDCVTIALQL